MDGRRKTGGGDNNQRSIHKRPKCLHTYTHRSCTHTRKAKGFLNESLATTTPLPLPKAVKAEEKYRNLRADASDPNLRCRNIKPELCSPIWPVYSAHVSCVGGGEGRCSMFTQWTKKKKCSNKPWPNLVLWPSGICIPISPLSAMT